MIFQVSLKNEPVAPWQEVGCCEACWMAKEERCVCRCGGEYHGFGGNQTEEKRNRVKKHLRSEFERYEAYPSAQLYKKLMSRTRCHCGYDLKNGAILAYSHPNGWEVAETDELQWLWISCPVCGYDVAIWKLGVPRNASILQEVTL